VSSGRRALAALVPATEDGRLPVVTDASPCASMLAAVVEGTSLRTFDFPTLWAREVVPRLPPPRRRIPRAVVHPTCSLRQSGGMADLLAVAGACADEVRVPLSAECCGFAGDRGFFFPEVTGAALATEAAEIRALLTPGAGLYSTSRTCEIGVARAVGSPCRSIVHLVHGALRG
jgi:D-lactate dehydrogenase